MAKAKAELTELTKAVQKELQDRLEAIDHARLSMGDAWIVIGRELAAVRELLPHGQFMPWVAENCGFSHRTVNNYIAAYGAFGKFATVANLDCRAMYLLAKSEPAVAEAKSLCSRGHRIGETKAKEIVAKHTPSKPKPEPAAQGIDATAAEAEDLAEADKTPSQKCDEHNTAIESFCRRLTEWFKAETPKMPWVSEGLVNSARGNLKACCDTFRGVKCAVCPACEGGGCKGCKDVGYLPKGSAAQLGRIAV